ncbi:tetratricopeptide repeat protein [Methylocucumis oryzae]|uniref:tetratricopeptide repeat protein n=1 Tax=Methylocucumis oryzae TaxID=1632867 RepID=UPI0006971CF7|nr:tetratricopeptide repeat protein [Methylocucumis oryzae]
MSDNYDTETQPLFKLLRTEAFRFIIVRYRHFSSVQRLQADLRQRFPDRPITTIDAALPAFDYRAFSQRYFTQTRGFFFIEHFDDVLKEQRDSLGQETREMAQHNERRRNITAGLNLRRDRLAQHPIALFVFIAGSAGELYAKTIMEKMPDLWSFRSLLMDLTYFPELSIDATAEALPMQSIKLSAINAEAEPQSNEELARLLRNLQETPDTETAYRLTLYPQIAERQTDLGLYHAALATLDEWQQQAGQNQALILIKKADLLTTLGELQTGLTLHQQALNLYRQENDLANISLCYERIGSIYIELGDLAQALIYFEQCLSLSKELYAANLNNEWFKHNLAIAYERLGNTQTALGDLAQALTYFEEFLRLGKELYAAYPNNVSFKNGLAIAHEKLGTTQKALGNLTQALAYFEQDLSLSQELYATYPSNMSFKHGVAIAYSKLGETKTAQGDLTQALTYFEEYLRLCKELYSAYPSDVSFKNSLALALANLGRLHLQLNQLDLTRDYFNRSQTLWAELVHSAPDFKAFQNHLAWVKQILAALSKL